MPIFIRGTPDVKGALSTRKVDELEKNLLSFAAQEFQIDCAIKNAYIFARQMIMRRTQKCKWQFSLQNHAADHIH